MAFHFRALLAEDATDVVTGNGPFSARFADGFQRLLIQTGLLVLFLFFPFPQSHPVGIASAVDLVYLVSVGPSTATVSALQVRNSRNTVVRIETVVLQRELVIAGNSEQEKLLAVVLLETATDSVQGNEFPTRTVDCAIDDSTTGSVAFGVGAGFRMGSKREQSKSGKRNLNRRHLEERNRE